MRLSTLTRICEIPIAFSKGKKSPFELALSSGFILANKRNSLEQIKKYVETRESLLTWWQQWSDDKRTDKGYYLRLENNVVGYFDFHKGGIIREIEYDTAIEACSEFILLEISSILNIRLAKKNIRNVKWDFLM
jgi:hypothetical protein